MTSQQNRNNELTISNHTKAEVNQAFRSAIAFMISDSLHLTPEETSWVIYQSGNILKKYEDQLPTDLPSNVSHELATGGLSKALEERKEGAYLKENITGIKTTASGWVETIYSMVKHSYKLTSMQEAELQARFNALLDQLGVGGKKNPRAALYLPTAVRWRTAQKENA